jgi:hypothetical protein
MNLLNLLYENRCLVVSDINEHLPTLKRYAEDCEHITEMGVREANSTFGFLMGKPKVMISIDILPLEQFGNEESAIKKIASDNGVDFHFILANTLEIEIGETDLLFLDTDHTYEQVKKELSLHGNKSKKYIIFHDTTTFANGGFEKDEIGIWSAIEEFIDMNPHWIINEKFENNNGLTILKRI